MVNQGFNSYSTETRFEKEVYQVSMNENSPPGTTVARIKAEDQDSGLFGTEGIRYTSITGSIANECVNTQHTRI